MEKVVELRQVRMSRHRLSAWLVVIGIVLLWLVVRYGLCDSARHWNSRRGQGGCALIDTDISVGVAEVFYAAPQDPSTLPIGVAPKPIPGVKPVDKTVSIRPAVPARTNDRAELLLLRKRKPLSAEWLKMNRLNVDLVRKDEAELNDVIDKLNNIPGFISLSALWNRPGAIAKIAATRSTIFKITINKAAVAVQVSKQSKDNLQVVADIHAKVMATLGVGAMQDISGVREEVLKVLGGDGGFAKNSINNPLAERKVQK